MNYYLLTYASDNYWPIIKAALIIWATWRNYDNPNIRYIISTLKCKEKRQENKQRKKDHQASCIYLNLAMSNMVSIPVAGDKLEDMFVNHTADFL